MRSAALAFFLTLLFGAPGTRAEPTVLVASWDDAITPVTGDYLNDAMTRALEDSAAAFVIVLDTPGGLLDSTRDIVSRFLESEIPVIVWVGPAGARAASAGTFLTLAAHVAAMAPGTNIGAASPITMGGGGADSTMGHKMQNDAAAFIRTIAERRGRNVAWAERTVRDASASTEKEALDAGAIDLIAASVEEVLEKASGRTVQTKNGATTLELRGARIEHYELDLRTKILSLLANPNVAYLLLMLGFYGIFFELSNPGSVLPGVLLHAAASAECRRAFDGGGRSHSLHSRDQGDELRALDHRRHRRHGLGRSHALRFSRAGAARFAALRNSVHDRDRASLCDRHRSRRADDAQASDDGT
jgi:membrane-bound serine protease (ClpP class)